MNQMVLVGIDPRVSRLGVKIVSLYTTETHVYKIDNIFQGVDLDKLLDAGLFISKALNRPSYSKVATAVGKSKL